MNKHRAKRIDYCTLEYRGVTIEELAKKYTNSAGFQFTVGQEHHDWLLRPLVEATLKGAKEEIDYYYDVEAPLMGDV